MFIHTVGQQQANVSQQSSTKPVARRTENNEPIIFDLRERDDGVVEFEQFTSTLEMMVVSQKWKIAG